MQLHSVPIINFHQSVNNIKSKLFFSDFDPKLLSETLSCRSKIHQFIYLSCRREGRSVKSRSKLGKHNEKKPPVTQKYTMFVIKLCPFSEESSVRFLPLFLKEEHPLYTSERPCYTHSSALRMSRISFRSSDHTQQRAVIKCS